jgi:GTP cyclohydrolase II
MVSCGGPFDIRTYAGAICILKYFWVPYSRKINLATNNPRKANIFQENGYEIADYTPVLIEPNEHTAEHLKAKQQYLGHKDLVGNGLLQ